MAKIWISIQLSHCEVDAPISVAMSSGSEQLTIDEASALRDFLDEAINYDPQEEITIGEVG